ncbi:MAG: hypothetical protein RMI94_11570 [Bryobacterales bacterium]|nr:hypothetical protein [Bryobacteraceae bacterium]MDW8131181.1 hypothetical protein [Bryobacterales bacterium]
MSSETLQALLWIVLPGFVAVGSALLSALIMQARMEVSLARERAATAEARALALAQNQQVEERIRAAEEAARRHALEELLSDLRIEERRYIRESKSLFVTRKCLVVQERLFFRNLPLSDWIEREYWLEETGDSAAQTIASTSRKLLPVTPRPAG